MLLAGSASEDGQEGEGHCKSSTSSVVINSSVSTAAPTGCHFIPIVSLAYCLLQAPPAQAAASPAASAVKAPKTTVSPRFSKLVYALKFICHGSQPVHVSLLALRFYFVLQAPPALAAPVAAPIRPANPPTFVGIRLGDGEYRRSPLGWNSPTEQGVKDMHDSTLLDALSKNSIFATTLEGVALDKCMIRIVKTIAGMKPTKAEEDRGLVLELAHTVGTLAEQRTTGEGLFIHVLLPAPKNAKPVGIGMCITNT
jgi:hypothetical protein